MDFLDLLARDCRIYIHNLAARLGVPVKGKRLAEGMKPPPSTMNWDRAVWKRHPEGRSELRGRDRRFWFTELNTTRVRQMAYLKQLKKVS